MNESIRERLDALDLTRITVSDVAELKNATLRRVLLEAMGGIAAAPQHHSHATHSNHTQSIAIDGLDGSLGR